MRTLEELAKKPHEENVCWKCGKFISTQTLMGIFCEECCNDFTEFEMKKLGNMWEWEDEKTHSRLIAEFIEETEKVILN